MIFISDSDIFYFIILEIILILALIFMLIFEQKKRENELKNRCFHCKMKDEIR